jgi:hypothetical protein
MKRGDFGNREGYDSTEFLWQGAGGSSIQAHVLWNGYAAGRWLDWEHVPGFMTKILAGEVARRIVQEVKPRCRCV